MNMRLVPARTFGGIFKCAHPLRVVYRYSNGVCLLGCDTCDVATPVFCRDHPQLAMAERAAWARVTEGPPLLQPEGPFLGSGA